MLFFANIANETILLVRGPFRVLLMGQNQLVHATMICTSTLKASSER